MLSGKFYQGKPCKYGHSGLRRTSNRTCVECEKAQKAAYYQEHGVLVRAETAEYYATNVEACKARKRRWKANNSGKQNAYHAARRAAKLRATPRWANLEAIERFYENCPTGYQVDHIVPLQSDIVCGLHWEGNLQYLTGPENAAKRNYWWPDMPE